MYLQWFNFRYFDVNLAKIIYTKKIKFLKIYTCNQDDDFLFELSEFIIILEVNENKHSGYCKKKEVKRMDDIKNTLYKPVKFIRYNPDLNKITMEEKESKLLEMINEWTTKNIEEFKDDVLYLFY